MSGMMVVVIGASLLFSSDLPAYGWILFGVFFLAYFGFFVYSFTKQKAQYSLRSMFLLGFCVALGCSLYCYIGKAIVIVLCAVYCGLMVYSIARSTSEK
jgi:hypothetical protein